jgi:hypothetical protein
LDKDIRERNLPNNPHFVILKVWSKGPHKWDEKEKGFWGRFFFPKVFLSKNYHNVWFID